LEKICFKITYLKTLSYINKLIDWHPFEKFYPRESWNFCQITLLKRGETCFQFTQNAKERKNSKYRKIKVISFKNWGKNVRKKGLKVKKV